MPRVGVITGTRREAACLRHQSVQDRFEIACSGADAACACALAAALVAAGCDALLSFGVAGGLDPALASGTVVVADAVIAPDGGTLETDAAWRGALLAELRDAKLVCATGRVVGVDRPVGDPEPKRLLFAGTGALAVDMESHAVLRAARRCGVPALVIRAIADGAHDAMPELAMAAVGPQGRMRYGALAAALLRQPGDLGGLVRLARASRPAFASLRRVAALPRLCGPL